MAVLSKSARQTSVHHRCPEVVEEQSDFEEVFPGGLTLQRPRAAMVLRIRGGGCGGSKPGDAPGDEEPTKLHLSGPGEPPKPMEQLLGQPDTPPANGELATIPSDDATVVAAVPAADVISRFHSKASVFEPGCAALVSSAALSIKESLCRSRDPGRWPIAVQVVQRGTCRGSGA